MSAARHDVSITDSVIRNFEAYTLCPAETTACIAPSRDILDRRNRLDAPRKAAEVAALIERLVGPDSSPWAADDVIGSLRREKYIENSVEKARQSLARRVVRETYYRLRPAMPVAFRKHLQKLSLRRWRSKPFPEWPVDVSVERLVGRLWERVLREHGVRELPFIWFWPEGKAGACIMTHDVEEAAGRDFCASLMQMEAGFDIVSAFEIVPEVRYEVPEEFLQSIRDGGCEVCLHGLNHDGRLFSSLEIFRARVPRIKEYAAAWGAIGFRSPVMYRNLDWLPDLGFPYDMSVPNVGHLDPQPGGCCTVMPYFIGPMLELPLTTVQDYTLFNILEERSTRLWEAQIDRVIANNGLLSFIVHPDYVNEPWSTSIYLTLLQRLAELRRDSNVWFALPREVNDWWRTRQALRLVKTGRTWRIDGPGADRARIAYARVEDGVTRYRVSPSG